MEKAFKRKKRETNVVFVILFVIFVVYTFLILFSLGWAFLTSLKSADDFEFNRNVLAFPSLKPDDIDPFNSRSAFLHLDNYVKIIKNFKVIQKQPFYRGDVLITHYCEATIGDMLLNTILYVGGGALIYALMPAFTAYLCAKYNYKLSGIMFGIYTFMMCMPIVGSYPTELTFLRDSGLYDTIWGNYIQKMTGGGMYFFVYHAFFKGVPDAFREAAEIDGASEFTIMVRIFFPLAVKIILTVFLIQFVALWNDYQTPLLYLPTHPTLAYGVFYLSYFQMHEWYHTPIRMAGCIMLVIPILIIFIAFKNKLMGDISLGGIKE